MKFHYWEKLEECDTFTKWQIQRVISGAKLSKIYKNQYCLSPPFSWVLGTFPIAFMMLIEWVDKERNTKSFELVILLTIFFLTLKWHYTFRSVMSNIFNLLDSRLDEDFWRINYRIQFFSEEGGQDILKSG